MKYLVIVLLLGVITQSGCYYDNHEILNRGSVCDTTVVTFSGTIGPLLNTNCAGCHTGTNAPQGIRLDNHAGARIVALNGRMIGAVTHAPGFSPMPQGGNQLSSCNIAKIRKWIAGGALNN